MTEFAARVALIGHGGNPDAGPASHPKNNDSAQPLRGTSAQKKGTSRRLDVEELVETIDSVLRTRASVPSITVAPPRPE